MTDYEQRVKALREYSGCRKGELARITSDAADAIEALDRLLDQNTKRCEALRKQLREAHENYEKHLNELEQQLPKRGQYVHGRELSREYIGDCLVSIDYEDWRCSVCGIVFEQWSIPKYKFCPNCGAKMEVQDEGA